MPRAIYSKLKACFYFFKLLDGFSPSYSKPLASSESFLGHLCAAILSSLGVVFIVSWYSLCYLSHASSSSLTPWLCLLPERCPVLCSSAARWAFSGYIISNLPLSLTSANPCNRTISLTVHECVNYMYKKQLGNGKYKTEPKLLWSLM